MIAAAIYTPALTIARSQILTDRIEAARGGMAAALNAWAVNSPRWGANRKADGLGPIDLAVAGLAAWQAQGGAALANDAAVTALLNAARHWLHSRKFLGLRVTGWREGAIHALYWQTAWAYCCDNFA